MPMLFMSKTLALLTQSSKQLPTKSGFGAVSGVLLLSSGTLAVSLAVLGSAVSYTDVVFRRELRVQAALDRDACEESAALLKAKDVFATGLIELQEFNCSSDVSGL